MTHFHFRNRLRILFIALPLLLLLFFLASIVTRFFFRVARLAPDGVLYTITFSFTVLTIFMLALVFRNVFTLIQDRRHKRAGSIIRSRLTLSFLLVTFIPVFILGAVIAFILGIGIQAVYRPEVEASLNQTVRILRSQREADRNRLVRETDRLLSRRGGFFMVQATGAEGILAYGRYKKGLSRPAWMAPALYSALRERIDARTIRPLHHRGRIAYLYQKPVSGGVAFALIDPRGPGGKIAADVLSALGRYRQLKMLIDPLGVALVYLTLFAILLSTLLVLFLSFRISRSITAPLNDLGEATRRVAQGDLNYRVTYPKSDAVGFLVDNFNTMTDQLSRSRLQLYNAQRLAAWQEVARRLAHELKNPLTPIRLSAERLLRLSHKGEQDLALLVERMVPTILSEVQVIEELVNEFSSFARMPALRKEQTEIVSWLRDIATGYRSAGAAATIIFEADMSSCMVRLDRTQMRRAVSNLVQNALRALVGQAEGTVWIRIESKNDAVCLIVSDNGHGIPTEIQSKIFQPYFTASEGGTGLGLAIVEKIVLEHGGRIEFQSSRDSGSKFSIVLPTGGA